MISNILVEIPPTPEAGVVNLQLNRQIEINISAEEARRKVNQYIHLEVSTQMHAHQPVLVVGDTVAWRVPVHLTFPSFGDVGWVGFMVVNPITGELDNLEHDTQVITDYAQTLALRFTSPPTG